MHFNELLIFLDNCNFVVILKLSCSALNVFNYHCILFIDWKPYRGSVPDSMTTLGQRWLKVVSSAGPTLGKLHFAHRANVRQRVGSTLAQRCKFFPITFCHVRPTDMAYYSQRKKSHCVKFGRRKLSYNLE